MENTKASSATDRFEGALKNQEEGRYILRLYVAGATPASTRAIEKVTALCEQWLKGRYELNVVDIYQQPDAMQGLEIIAVPTLVKLMPSPLRRLIGDMSKEEKLLLGLGIGPQEDKPLASRHSHPTRTLAGD